MLRQPTLSAHFAENITLASTSIDSSTQLQQRLNLGSESVNDLAFQRGHKAGWLRVHPLPTPYCEMGTQRCQRW
jgi:hypothetical protein